MVDDIAADFEEARRVMFDGARLTSAQVDAVVTRLPDDEEATELKRLTVIYKRLVDQLPKLIERRKKIGAAARLFT